MALWQWSTTPANNASAGAIDWAEGQPPSTVNDSARQMMADVATWFAAPEWLNYGLTPTFVSSTQFTVAGNKTAIFSSARRIKATVTAGTVYGTITSSDFTSLTIVNVTLDSGSFDSGLSEVNVGILNPANASLSGVGGNFAALGGTLVVGSTTANSGDARVYMENTSKNGYLYLNTSGVLAYFDTQLGGTRFSSDSSGNFTATGNITAASDERLKAEWGTLGDDFVERLAVIRSGTYTRIDTEQRHVGVGAQSLQALLPEAVVESDKGILSVAYGQAALAACVELAKEVVRLRALLEQAK